jgi:hypothetical protein
MKVVERVRDGAVRHRLESEGINRFNRPESEGVAKTRNIRLVSDLDRMTRQLRRATERNMVAFDEGFGAAVLMVANGADLEQLKAACGTVAREWQDTEPVALVDWDEDTVAD